MCVKLGVWGLGWVCGEGVKGCNTPLVREFAMWAALLPTLTRLACLPANEDLFPVGGFLIQGFI